MWAVLEKGDGRVVAAVSGAGLSVAHQKRAAGYGVVGPRREARFCCIYV